MPIAMAVLIVANGLTQLEVNELAVEQECWGRALDWRRSSY